MTATRSIEAARPPLLRSISAVLVVASLAFLLIGLFVPLVGALLLMLAPSLLLLGVALFLTQLIVPKRQNLLRLLVFCVLLVILGLNSRIPSFVEDALTNRDSTTIVRTLAIPIGSSIRLNSNVAEVSARQSPYASALPRCADQLCLWMAGFGPSLVGDQQFYWKEVLLDSILQSGLTTADTGVPIATLRIQSVAVDPDVTRLDMAMIDDANNVLAEATRYYRNGFPFESPDYPSTQQTLGETPPESFSYGLDFALHGNLVSMFVSGHSERYPVESFIKTVTAPTMPAVATTKFASASVTLKRQELFDPPLILDEWNSLLQDKPREDFCKHHVLQQFAERWWTRAEFHRNEETGRRWLAGFDSINLVRFQDDHTLGTTLRIDNRTLVCEGDALYAFGPSPDPSRYQIEKFRRDGTPLFSMSFVRPAAKDGFHGTVLARSISETDGVLRFEFWDVRQEGARLLISSKRQLTIQPTPQI